MAQTELARLAAAVGERLRPRGEWIGTAESCTGGGIAHALTEIPGSSTYVKGGVVAYHEDVKARLLDVDPELIARFGVVSREVAFAMAQGAKKALSCEWSVSTTGVAGPGGGTALHPVGTVFACVDGPPGATHYRFQCDGDRSAVKLAAACAVLSALVERLDRI